MQIKIKRIDPSLPLPEYKTSGAAAFDLYARIDTIIPAQGWAKVPGNFIIQIPFGYVLSVSARSSLAKYYTGLFLPNAPGLVDSDYGGPNDEILISLYNMTGKDIVVKRADRIAQAIIIKVERAEFSEIHDIGNGNENENKDRGGFGSTGLR